MVLPYAHERRGGASASKRCFLAVAPILLLFVTTPTASAATYSVPLSDTAVVTGLIAPTDFAFLPDGRILILEKAGRVIVAGGGLPQPLVALDIQGAVDDLSERGLLGICLHPGFATNGYVFFYYTANGPKNRISRFTLAGNTISAASESVVLDDISAAAGNHNGGTIAIGPDGKLYAAPGDAGTSNNAQILVPGNFSGKVLRLELDGSPAAGNPYLGDGTKEPRIFAHGFRNPFRFSFRGSNGSLYVGDVGSSGAQDREELNVVVSGGNYGWPWAEGTTIYTPPCTGCLPPVYDYPRATGTTIIGGVFVTGNAYPSFLQGKYVFGDNAASWIRYLEFTAGDALVGGLQNLGTSAEGPVAFHVGLDGHVYYAAINTGRIYRITAASNLHTLPPCRVFDTRQPAGAYGGPRLAANSDRSFLLAGRCGIPPSARAVSVNLTVTEPTDGGYLAAFPTGAPTNTSTLNFRAGQTRANNAVIGLDSAGNLVIRCGMTTGGAHAVLDVNGYFE